MELDEIQIHAMRVKYKYGVVPDDGEIVDDVRNLLDTCAALLKENERLKVGKVKQLALEDMK